MKLHCSGSHFGRLLNVIQDDGLCDMPCDTGYSDDIHVSTNEVVLSVQALGANKASGLDGIVAEHLLCSSERSLMCIWMTSAVSLIVVILDVCRGILLLTTLCMQTIWC